jgi:hypothetical protein
MNKNLFKGLLFILGSLLLISVYYVASSKKQYPIHVDGQTEYRRYEYDCDSIVGNYAYRDGVKLKLAGKTEHFFNEEK